MRKIEIIELIADHLAGDMPSDMVSRYHPAIIKSALNVVFNQAIYQTWLDGKRFSDYSQLDAWTRSFELSIEAGYISPNSNIVSGRAVLPFPPVQLPNNMGIRQITMRSHSGIAFAYMEKSSAVIFYALDYWQVDMTPTFTLEQQDIAGVLSYVLSLDKIPRSRFESDPFIRVDMIVPFEMIGDYDVIAIPAAKEDILVKTTIEFLRSKLPEDLVNDLNVNIPTQ